MQNFPIGKFLQRKLAPVLFWEVVSLLQGISLQRICCVTRFHNNACSILPVGQRGQSLRGGASPAPVVAENFLYAGAQNPSASPVKEVAPPVRGGGEFIVGYYCLLTTFTYFSGRWANFLHRIFFFTRFFFLFFFTIFLSNILSHSKNYVLPF